MLALLYFTGQAKPWSATPKHAQRGNDTQAPPTLRNAPRVCKGLHGLELSAGLFLAGQHLQPGGKNAPTFLIDEEETHARANIARPRYLCLGGEWVRFDAGYVKLHIYDFIRLEDASRTHSQTAFTVLTIAVEIASSAMVLSCTTACTG